MAEPIPPMPYQPSNDGSTDHQGAQSGADPRELAIRKEALKRVKEKRDLRNNASSWAIFAVLFITIWLTTGGGFFWPAFPILGWGLGVFFQWRSISDRGITDEQIRVESARIEQQLGYGAAPREMPRLDGPQDQLRPRPEE